MNHISFPKPEIYMCLSFTFKQTSEVVLIKRDSLKFIFHEMLELFMSPGLI